MAPSQTVETPGSVDEAAAILARISRLCVYDCPEGGECVDSECDAGRQTRAAADYLVASWVDDEG
jgi:hypothetical protein